MNADNDIVIPLHSLMLSRRSYNALKNAKYENFYDLTKITLDDFEMIRGLGKSSQREIKEIMRQLLMQFKSNKQIQYVAMDLDETVLEKMPDKIDTLEYFIYNIKREIECFEMEIKLIKEFFEKLMKK